MTTQIFPQSATRTPTDPRNMPPLSRAANLVPSTFNEADNTIDVVWTTGARVRRYDWWTESAYEEELAVTPEAVDMSRFEAGTVQVLDGHRTYGGVDSILGIALRGSVENEVAGIVSDIRAGIIRAISFGYTISKYEIKRAIDRTDGVNMPLYRAVAWQPNEISFVTVPADADASTRSQPANGVPCEFFTRAPAHSSPNQQEINMLVQGAQPGASTAVPTEATRAAAPAQLPPARRLRPRLPATTLPLVLPKMRRPARPRLPKSAPVTAWASGQRA